MDRLDFVRCQPWFEEEAAAKANNAAAFPLQPLTPLRTSEQAFAAFEIFEGLARFALVDDTEAEAANYDAGEGGPLSIAFRASLLTSSWETRVRLAIRPMANKPGEPPVGTKRRRDSDEPTSAAPAAGPACCHRNAATAASAASGTSELLVRFESSGRALQGRLLHTHIIRMTENISDLTHPPAGNGGGGGGLDTPYLSLRLTPCLELRLSALPEVAYAAGAEQLRLVVGRMLSSLPRATVASASGGGAAGCGARATPAQRLPESARARMAAHESLLAPHVAPSASSTPIAASAARLAAPHVPNGGAGTSAAASASPSGEAAAAAAAADASQAADASRHRAAHAAATPTAHGDCAQRVASFHAFVSCASELADEVERKATSSTPPLGGRRTGAIPATAIPATAVAGRSGGAAGGGAPGGAPTLFGGAGGGGSLFGGLASGVRAAAFGATAAHGERDAVAELLSALPMHLSRAMAATSEQEQTSLAEAEAREAAAEAHYRDCAMRLLQGLPPPPGSSSGLSLEEEVRRAREEFKRAMEATLAARLLPSRAVPLT